MIIITLPWCYNSAITLMHFLANFCISCVVNNHLFVCFLLLHGPFTWREYFHPKCILYLKLILWTVRRDEAIKTHILTGLECSMQTAHWRTREGGLPNFKNTLLPREKLPNSQWKKKPVVGPHWANQKIATDLWAWSENIRHSNAGLCSTQRSNMNCD